MCHFFFSYFVFYSSHVFFINLLFKKKTGFIALQAPQSKINDCKMYLKLFEILKILICGFIVCQNNSKYFKTRQ